MHRGPWSPRRGFQEKGKGEPDPYRLLVKSGKQLGREDSSSSRWTPWTKWQVTAGVLCSRTRVKKGPVGPEGGESRCTEVEHALQGKCVHHKIMGSRESMFQKVHSYKNDKWSKSLMFILGTERIAPNKLSSYFPFLSFSYLLSGTYFNLHLFFKNRCTF